MSCAIPIPPYDLTYYVGDTVGILATVTNPTTNAAFNLTSCGVSFTVTDRQSGSNVWSMSIGSGVSIVSASGGTALIQPSLSQSNNLTKGTVYDSRIVVTDTNGAVITSGTGHLTAA